MAESALANAADVIAEAESLVAVGNTRAAIDLLTESNRASRNARIERTLVRLRREGAEIPAGGAPGPGAPRIEWDGVVERELVEVDRSDLNVDAVRAGFARTGCLLVRGLVPPDRAAGLASGIDSALAAYDASEAGEESGPEWYSPFSMPDKDSRPVGSAPDQRVASQQKHMPEKFRRRFVREDGGLWTANSPRMLFELFELVDDVGIGRLMTEFIGERPVLSANKCTLRRVAHDHASGGWHQDGAFLGEDIAAFNFWVTLTPCGLESPGLEVVPRRFDHVLAATGQGSEFDWSLTHAAVLEAAGDQPIVRPEFQAGDALLFDHLLVHRTAAAESARHDRYAIESWFFGPSSYPLGQLPLLY